MIHPSADVKSETIGINTTIWQYVVVLGRASIGENCNINAHCFIENEVIIGNNVTLKCGVYLWDGMTIEDNVFIGPNVTFANDKYPRAKQHFKLLKTIIQKGASIGANSTIIGGITIQSYALIGAGSLITKNIPNNTIWIGNPAKCIGYVCDCGTKLNTELTCNNCSSEYKLMNELIKKI